MKIKNIINKYYLRKMCAYRKDFDETKYVFLINDAELLKRI